LNLKYSWNGILSCLTAARACGSYTSQKVNRIVIILPISLPKTSRTLLKTYYWETLSPFKELLQTIQIELIVEIDLVKNSLI
jgi:hypothetical protein